MKLYTEKAPETEDVGIADGDIDGFLKNLLPNVNRECAQNSNDEARVRPVEMNFQLLEIPISDIPDIKSYREVIEQCFADAIDTESKKGKEFFGNAKKVLAKEKIKVLVISDSGTKGAGGDFEKGGKFYTLVVSKGRTDKDNVYSAGSFGIGKNAAFAGSELRLVFYSSKFEGGTGFYCMGKSVLTSWKKNGANMSHKVFFGAEIESLRPAESEDEVPSWLLRRERGLSIAIVAPRIELKEGWSHGYVATLLSNFFMAIYDGLMQFSLDAGRVVLNKASMHQYFLHEKVKKEAEDMGGSERLDIGRYCVEGLVNNDFVSEEVSIAGLGDFEVLVRVAEDMPKKVVFIRNGMFITDSLHSFGRPLVRFPNTKDFIAIVRPKRIDDPSSEMIKRMENPDHSELTTGFIADEDEVKKLTSAMRNLEKSVRKVIAKYAKLEVKEERSIEELRRYFPGAEPSEQEIPEKDPTRVLVDPKGTKAFAGGRAQAGGGKKGGKGARGGGRKRGGETGPGKNQGRYKQTDLKYRSLRARGKTEWYVHFQSLPDSGKLEVWPEEEPRSGRDSKAVKILSCDAPGASVSSDQLSVSIPLENAEFEAFNIVLDREVSVLGMRPVVKGEAE